MSIKIGLNCNIVDHAYNVDEITYLLGYQPKPFAISVTPYKLIVIIFTPPQTIDVWDGRISRDHHDVKRTPSRLDNFIRSS